MKKQAVINEEKIKEKELSNKNKITQALSSGGSMSGAKGKYSKLLDKKTKNNAQADEVELTKERKKYIKNNMSDNQSSPGAWKLAVQMVKEENPDKPYSEILKLASVQYRKNIERR